jgi:hypothetical protein
MVLLTIPNFRTADGQIDRILDRRSSSLDGSIKQPPEVGTNVL